MLVSSPAPRIAASREALKRRSFSRFSSVRLLTSISAKDGIVPASVLSATDWRSTASPALFAGSLFRAAPGEPSQREAPSIPTPSSWSRHSAVGTTTTSVSQGASSTIFKFARLKAFWPTLSTSTSQRFVVSSKRNNLPRKPFKSLACARPCNSTAAPSRMAALERFPTIGAIGGGAVAPPRLRVRRPSLSAAAGVVSTRSAREPPNAAQLRFAPSASAAPPRQAAAGTAPEESPFRFAKPGASTSAA
mmetsp:Transcript_40193/g.110512  ORF Transcript_40193/g.110512 Transcript_40193/m.110512 type:complete len:248 (+) Transcript_40193:629-1372(+)